MVNPKKMLTNDDVKRIRSLSTCARMFPNKSNNPLTKNTNPMTPKNTLRFSHYEPNRDFGLFKRRSLKEREFRFERPIEAYAITRIDESTFMIMTTYHHGEEEFDLNLYLSKTHILDVCEMIVEEFPELSIFLSDQYEKPFSFKDADFMEVDFPERTTLLISLTARLLIEYEHEYIALGNEFLPFIATKIHDCSVKDD